MGMAGNGQMVKILKNRRILRMMGATQRGLHATALFAFTIVAFATLFTYLWTPEVDASVAASAGIGTDTVSLAVPNSSQSATVPSAPADEGDEAWDGRFGLPGVNGAISSIAIIGSDTYVAGTFTLAGNVAVRNIARWDGSAWHPLGTGVDNAVHDLATDGTNLYVGGYFTEAGGLTVGKVARWDGSQWYTLGTGIPTGEVFALGFGGGNLYVGGRFTDAGGVQAANIARWNGSQWYSLGSAPGGVSASVY